MIQAEHDLMPVVPILLLTGMAGSSLLFILRWPGNRRTHQHHHQPVFRTSPTPVSTNCCWLTHLPSLAGEIVWLFPM